MGLACLVTAICLCIYDTFRFFGYLDDKRARDNWARVRRVQDGLSDVSCRCYAYRIDRCNKYDQFWWLRVICWIGISVLSGVGAQLIWGVNLGFAIIFSFVISALAIKIGARILDRVFLCLESKNSFWSRKK